MIKYLVLGASILFFIAGGLFFWMGQHYAMYPQAGSYGATTSTFAAHATSTSVIPSGSTSSSTVTVSESYIVNANDVGANQTHLWAKKGDIVQVTFNVNATGTSHGGLDFRSPVINTGPISPGGSKTITFTADGHFDFIPYWPSTNTPQPYKIQVAIIVP